MNNEASLITSSILAPKDTQARIVYAQGLTSNPDLASIYASRITAMIAPIDNHALRIFSNICYSVDKPSLWSIALPKSLTAIDATLPEITPNIKHNINATTSIFSLPVKK